MQNLAGKLLIASPTTTPGSFFDRSIIYMIKSDEEGSMGVMVNSPLVKLNGNLNISSSDASKELYIQSLDTYSGGPVDVEKGFILELQKKSLSENEVIKLSSSVDALRKISKKNRSKYTMFLFGYCGWDAGQLEEELKDNHWIITDANKKLIFDTDNNVKWEKAMAQINIHPVYYSHSIGNC